MKTIFALLSLAALASAIDLSAYQPIEEYYLQDPVKYPLFAKLYRQRQGERIVGGQIATPGQFPHQVALFITASNGNFFCGASLLNADYVLTAAHCADVALEIKVILGAQNVREAEKEQVEIIVPAANIKIHEKWNSKLIQNDIAILKLPVKAPKNTRIQPITLPSRKDVGKTLAGENSITSGWGKPKDSATAISPELRWVQTEIITNESCKNYYGSAISQGHICASGKGGKSSCNGDSGGPLTIGTGAQKKQVGIVSFGSAFGCSIGFPHAYTRITNYLDWIQQNSNLVIA